MEGSLISPAKGGLVSMTSKPRTCPSLRSHEILYRDSRNVAIYGKQSVTIIHVAQAIKLVEIRTAVTSDQHECLCDLDSAWIKVTAPKVA